MNPLVSIRIPCGTLSGGLAIGVVEVTPTHGNRDAIGESHREPTITVVSNEIETGKRIGDGVGVRGHACIIPQIGVRVKFRAYYFPPESPPPDREEDSPFLLRSLSISASSLSTFFFAAIPSRRIL